MHVIKRLMVNYDTPRQCLNFNQTDCWYSFSFDVTWPSNLGWSTFGRRILPLKSSRVNGEVGSDETTVLWFILETFTHYITIVSCTCVYLCDRRVKMCHSTTCRRCCIKSLTGWSTSWWHLRSLMLQPPCQVSQSPLAIVTQTVDKSNHCICLW